MAGENSQSFVQAAEANLLSLRSGLLILAQTGESSDLPAIRRDLATLRRSAEENLQTSVSKRIADCESTIMEPNGSGSISRTAVYSALDMVAGIEAELFNVPRESDDFVFDVDEFLDSSFDDLFLRPEVREEAEEQPEERFEVDDETLEIFRSEAEELLDGITNSLAALSQSPSDQSALWDIRRRAHTFKGAAGIVGSKRSSEIAHRMEDLLDKIVELGQNVDPEVISFLTASAAVLSSLICGTESAEASDLDERYSRVMSSLTTPTTKAKSAQPSAVPAESAPSTGKGSPTPVVRVSLERLDELLKISKNLVSNRCELEERFASFAAGTGCDAQSISKIGSLFETTRKLSDEMQSKLHHVRMVRFGTLETRLKRAVNVTCQDENKKAVLEIENGDIEIDTLVIDALIEPLLHLLKNAVVHGIEPCETRRLIGKPETGTIRLVIKADSRSVDLSVIDDGCGISVSRLKDKAVAKGLIDEEAAAALDDRQAMQLVFDRGLTTADKLDLNAGRGVGMSIVKESVENRRGSVDIESTPQRGTTFTLRMPLEDPEPESTVVAAEAPQSVENKAAELSPLVFVVDDSASVRHQTIALVEKTGARVISAGDGAEALEMLLSSVCEPDLILSDIEMPQIDGWEFLAYLKTDEHFGHIPVAMVSSLDSLEQRERAMNLGASAYVVKPLTGSRFEELLKELVKKVC